MKEDIEKLAIKIYYGQSKEIDLSVDDWIEKLNDLFVSPKKMKEDIEKEIEKILNLNFNPFCSGKRIHYGIRATEEKIKHVARVIYSLQKQEILEEMIKLSDKIESQYETEFNEWRAFKGFRNTLRDKLELLKQ